MSVPVSFWNDAKTEVLPPVNEKKAFTAALRAHVEANPLELRAAVSALLFRAQQGDVNAIREIADRLEGKSVAQIEAKVEATFKLSKDDENI